MLWNIEKNKVQTTVDCQVCKYFDKKLKKCNGLGKNCFVYDKKTGTVIDPVTKLAIKKLRNKE